MASKEMKEQPLEIYSPHGGKLTFHGLSYQLKLIMFFIVRSLRRNLRFRISTEIEEAGKFDDVVFKQFNGMREEFTFLQAKHCAGEAKNAVTARNLLQGCKGDFCLPMYLQSYQMIQDNPKFSGKNKDIKNLILYTNKGFKDYDRFCDFTLSEDIFEKKKFEDGRNKVDNILKTDLLRFKKDFEGKSFLMSHLKNAFVKIPKNFAECVVNGEVFHLKQNLPGGKDSDSYGKVLTREVIDPETQSFRDSFIEAVNLTPEAKHFRDVLKSESFNKHHGDENAFRELMKNMTVKVIGNVKHDVTEIDSPAKVAEKLASLMRKNWDQKTVVVNNRKSAIAKNIQVLADHVFARNKNQEIRFSSDFISGSNLRGDILEYRKLLEQELLKRNMEFTSINQFKFEIKNVEQASTLLSLCNEEIVETFLEKLVFAVNQPNHTELGNVIKEELQKEFKVIEADNVYGRFLENIFTWMADLKAIELSHEEGRTLFENLKTLSNIEKSKKRLKSYEDVLGILRSAYGEDNIDTLCMENNIADLLHLLCDYQKALSSCHELNYIQRRYIFLLLLSLALTELSIIQHHEYALNIKLILDNALGKLSQLEKALSSLQEVYEIYKDHLNGNLLMTLDAKFNSAPIFGKLRKYSDALHAYEQVFKKLTDIFGADNSRLDTMNILDTIYNISYVLLKLKDYKSTQKSNQEIGGTFLIIHGEIHEGALHCNFSALHILYDLEFYRYALHKNKDMYDKLTEFIGDNHPNSHSMKNGIPSKFYKLGECEKILQICEETTKKLNRNFGKFM